MHHSHSSILLAMDKTLCMHSTHTSAAKLFLAAQSCPAHVKRRFSELAREAFCNQEDACALQQRLDDEAKPVIAEGEPFVLQHPRVAALDGPAPLAQSRAGRLPPRVD